MTNTRLFRSFVIKNMIPYGISDYKELKEKGYYYIDKTRFIELIERQPPYLFLIRPRRFGKSLLISMLEAYYNINQKAEFDALFQGTLVHKHPTKGCNNYFVLKLDFSTVGSTNPEERFNEYLNNSLREFDKNYNFGIEFSSDYAISNFNTLISHGRLNRLPFYVLIDEYDNFINELLVKDEARYKSMVTGQEAVYKQFFKTLKAGTSGMDAPVKKIFVTGVSPLAMYDITSGFNIGTNITTDSNFNDMLGVTKEEVGEMLKLYDLTAQKDAIFARINDWYDGYKFSEESEYTIYNTDMVLYYLQSMIQKGREPKELIDINVRSDYSKIRFLIQTGKKLNGNFSVLQELLSEGKVSVSKIADSFSAFDIRDRNNFTSLLFYLGLVTIDKYESLQYSLKIPNQTIQKIMAEFMRKALEEQQLFDINLDAFTGKLSQFATRQDLSVFHYLAEQINAQSQVRDYIAGENYIKGFLVAYLSLAPFYEVITEKESNKGFVDIYLRPLTAGVPFGGALELKYIKRNELTPELLEEKTAEACAQLKRYRLPDNAVPVVLVFHGWELVKVLDARLHEAE
jgi:hypothetical protein